MPGDLHPPPSKPSGSSEFDHFCTWIWDMLTTRLKLINVPGVVTWDYTAKGIVAKFDIRAKKGGTDGSVSYEGDFVFGKSYKKGSIVRVKSGPSLGVCIALVDNTGIQPTYPEPVAPATVYWHFWSFGPQLFSQCAGGGTSTVYLNAN